MLWVGLEATPVVMANQFIGQVQQDEIILTFGAMVQPFLIGTTDEERREQAMQIAYVPIQPVMRLTLTQRRVEELQMVLRDTLELFAKRYGSGEDT